MGRHIHSSGFHWACLPQLPVHRSQWKFIFLIRHISFRVRIDSMLKLIRNYINPNGFAVHPISSSPQCSLLSTTTGNGNMRGSHAAPPPLIFLSHSACLSISSRSFHVLLTDVGTTAWVLNRPIATGRTLMNKLPVRPYTLLPSCGLCFYPLMKKCWKLALSSRKYPWEGSWLADSSRPLVQLQLFNTAQGSNQKKMMFLLYRICREAHSIYRFLINLTSSRCSSPRAIRPLCRKGICWKRSMFFLFDILGSAPFCRRHACK
jgi:hypothetical protein